MFFEYTQKLTNFLLKVLCAAGVRLKEFSIVFYLVPFNTFEGQQQCNHYIITLVSLAK
jgi:hypothetical protein